MPDHMVYGGNEELVIVKKLKRSDYHPEQRTFRRFNHKQAEGLVMSALDSALRRKMKHMKSGGY